MKIDSQYSEKFEHRHIGPDETQVKEMLETIGAKSIDQLIDETIPAGIRLKKPLALPAAQSEYDFLNSFRKMAEKNRIYKSFIGPRLR
jgi:glycine dehydrogenase